MLLPSSAYYKQGAIIVASLFQVLIGYLGVVGLVLKFVTPLTIAPAVTMIGLSLFSVVSDAFASTNWAISLGYENFCHIFRDAL